MKSSTSVIENNLIELEKNTSITSANKKCLLYSSFVAILSLFLFRPLYLYRKDVVYNKNKKPVQEKYNLSYYRCVGCFTVYSGLFFLLFKYYLKI